MDWSVYEHYAYAVVALLGTLVGVLALLWWMQRSPWQGWAHSLRGVAPPFINIVGVLFGLTLAFIANDTWSAHDKATTTVYRESDSLRSLMLLAGRLPEPGREGLKADLRAYARASASEWQDLAHRKVSPQADQAASALLLRVAAPELRLALGDGVQAMMLQSVMHVRDARDMRISLSQTHLNPFKWMGMAFLGFLCLLSVAVVHVEHPRAAAAALVLFALSAAPTAAMVLIQGNPFQAPSFVSAEPIVAAVK